MHGYLDATGQANVDALVVLDDVLIPWEDVLFYQHTRAAAEHACYQSTEHDDRDERDVVD